MLVLLLTLLSMVAGGALFVMMLGSDAWLIKGLKRDNFAATIVTCALLATAIGLYVVLRAFLPVVPELLAEALAPENPAATETAAATVVTETSLLEVVKWLLYLSIPILVSLILYGGYNACQWLARRLAAGGLAAVSRVSNRL